MRIRWTEGAVSNLDQVKEYIALENPSAAIATVNKIIDSAQTLADYPTVGKRGRERGTRELVVVGLPYIVIYAVQREELVNLRVLHTSMRYPSDLLCPPALTGQLCPAPLHSERTG